MTRQNNRRSNVGKFKEWIRDKNHPRYKTFEGEYQIRWIADDVYQIDYSFPFGDLQVVVPKEIVDIIKREAKKK